MIAQKTKKFLSQLDQVAEDETQQMDAFLKKLSYHRHSCKALRRLYWVLLLRQATSFRRFSAAPLL